VINPPRASSCDSSPGGLLLAIEPEHAVAAGLLDAPYEDPFDRMLVVQSRRPGARS